MRGRVIRRILKFDGRVSAITSISAILIRKKGIIFVVDVKLRIRFHFKNRNIRLTKTGAGYNSNLIVPPSSNQGGIEELQKHFFPEELFLTQKVGRASSQMISFNLFSPLCPQPLVCSRNLNNSIFLGHLFRSFGGDFGRYLSC